MRTLFIEAKSNAELKLSKEQIKKLPKKIGIATTIQHLHRIKEVQKQIPGSIMAGQILGCNASSARKIKNEVDAFLYVGSGVFHPIEIAIETGKEVFCFNPFTKVLSKIDEKEIGKYRKKKMASLARFLSSEKIGILVSTKPGQNRMKDALKLAERKDREYYIFAFDTLNELDLENFPFIKCWVNTACPRIADEKARIVNIDDLKELEK
ncbi:diphthamide synthesis protein [Candidatus Woesearchaeota archaeon]|nr:diphthamide synthesis protein [Candidatus Woesearchaeota archaeon]